MVCYDIFRRKKSDLCEMTVKQSSVFRGTASLEEYLEFSVIHTLIGMSHSRISSGPDSYV